MSCAPRKENVVICTRRHQKQSAEASDESRNSVFSKQEVQMLENSFVAHLQHMLEIQNNVLSKISDDANVGATQKAVEVSREMLRSRLAVACASEGAAKGTGLSEIANELVESLRKHMENPQTKLRSCEQSGLSCPRRSRSYRRPWKP